MKIIYYCRNYMCERMYVDTDAKKIATDEDQYRSNIDYSDVREFTNGFSGRNFDTPVITIANKKDYHTLKELFIKDGFELILAKPCAQTAI